MTRLSVLLLMVFVVSSGLLGGCSTASTVKRTLALNDLHIRAAIAEDEGDWDEAYALWSEYVDRRPQSALAEYRLGMVEMQLGLYQQAVGHLRVAHDLQPGNIGYIEALASAMIASGQTESLMTLLRQTAEEGAGWSGYLRMGSFAQQAGLMDEAREAYELAVVRARGASSEPYLHMADFARATGNQELEIQNLRYALWFDRADESVQSRLKAMGMIPGPSLALKPEF